ncbi:MAG: DciA family protein [Paracoccaceae bacterium]
MNKPRSKSNTRRRFRGFQRTSGLLQDQIRKVSESRGFAVSRLLTHWVDIVGAETAAIAMPVKVGYSRGGIGATLTILTTGSHAPMLQTDLPKIRDKVNACYGYAAISRIHITQTATTGFAEGKVAFTPVKVAAPKEPDPRINKIVGQTAAGVDNSQLRQALEELGRNIFIKSVPTKGS